ncbi:MAG: NAD(P)-dependent oxidoreductase [Oscillospiraceae bacterium]|nr:NAD(P)-dependent oxidoreductase [Oscillospiraceae bacterium]
MGNKRFPLFLDLTGRSAVIIGGGTVGLRRAEVLTRFGAAVTIVSPVLARPLEGVRHIPRKYQYGDFAGAFLALAAANDPETNAAAGREARERGVLFNRSDCPAECDFFFPAVCEGGGITAGVAGDGSDHRRTAAAARQIRELLGEYK